MAYDPRKRLQKLIFGIFLSIIVCYALFQMRDLLFGARLTVSNIADGATVTEQMLTIEGSMKHAAHITINGNEIKTNQDGYFSEQLLLSPGYNLITVHARDRFGSPIEKSYRVLYNEQASQEKTLE